MKLALKGDIIIYLLAFLNETLFAVLIDDNNAIICFTIVGGNMYYHWSTTPRVSPQVVNTANIRMVNGVSSKTLTKVHGKLEWIIVAISQKFSI